MSLRRSFILSFGRTGGQTLVQFLTNVAIARLLDPSEVGVFLIAYAGIMAFGALRDFGISRYIIKERDLTDAKMATVFGVAIIIGWSLAALIFAFRGAVARFYGQPELTSILAVLAAIYLVLPVSQPALAMLRREQRHGVLAMNALVTALTSSAVSIPLVALGMGPIGLAYGTLVATIVSSVLALRACPDHIRLVPSLVEWRSVLGFGSVASLGAIVAQLGQHSSALVLGRVMGPAEAALLQRANSLSTVVASLMVTSSNWVTGAAIGELYRSGSDLSRLAIRTTSYLTAVGWPVLAFVALKSDSIILILYGAKWLPTAQLLPPLCLSVGFTIFASQAAAVYDGTGAAALHLRNHAIALVVSVGLILIGAQYSLLAVAWLRPVATAIWALIHISVLRRYAGVGLWQLAWAMRASAALTLAFALAMAGMIELEPAGLQHNVFVLIVEAVCACPVYAALLFVVRHPIRAELPHLFGKIARQR